jgi:hypothetical protein
MVRHHHGGHCGDSFWLNRLSTADYCTGEIGVKKTGTLAIKQQLAFERIAFAYACTVAQQGIALEYG